YLGLEEQAAAYWERIIGREAGNNEAHLFLAEYYEKSGQLDRSLAHLESMLIRNPHNTAIYAQLGRVYEKVGESDRALLFYEKLLAENPQNQEAALRIAGINAEMGQKRRLHEVGPRRAPASAQLQTVKLKETIRNLEADGRYREAMQVYQQLIKTYPDDHEILPGLTNGLVIIGQNEGIDAMVELLSDTVSDNMAMYREIAELLRRMSRDEELLAVLGKIHELDPGNNLTTQELAILHLNRGDFLLSRRYFEKLSNADCVNSRCLEARATLAEKLNLPAHRLDDYEKLLELQPDRHEIRLKAMEIAAQLGLLDKALFHSGYLQGLASFSKKLEVKILLADTYRESGYLGRAVERYQNIIAQAAATNEERGLLRMRSWLGIVNSYKMLGLVYEAEQALRTALVNEKRRIPILAALFYLYLETGRVSESDVWLQAINQAVDDSQQDKFTQANLEWLKGFLQAEKYEAAGDYGLAIDLYKEAEALLQEYEYDNTALYGLDNIQPGLRLQMQLAVSHLQAEEYGEAERIVLELKKEHRGVAELLVLQEQIYLNWGKTAEAVAVAGESKEYAAQDFGRQLILAKLYGKYKNFSRQAETAGKAVTDKPESLAAKYLLVGASIEQREYAASLDLLEQFLRSYPENTWFLSEQVELLALTGDLQEALGVAGIILAENQDRRDIVLLQSRILWELNRWTDSVALYESMLEPPIEDILAGKIQELVLPVGQSPARSTWWDKITFAEGAPPRIADIIMSHQQAVDFSKDVQAVNTIAATYYAVYRWQEKFSKELSVRRSVMRQEYYHAANKLEQFIKEFGSNDFLLYDLAGLYSKLDRLGDEAAIYRRLEAQNTNFPGLSEAVQRNNLKRRPQVYLAYTVQDDDGWEGYKAVRQETVKGGWNYYQSSSQRWGIDVARNDYESTRDEQNLSGWRTMLTYDLKLSQVLRLSLGGGFEKLTSDYDDTFLFSGAFTGKIADEMRAVFSVKQDVVADTIASLKRNIKKRDYKIEFLFDLFPRLLLGGYFNYMEYSDSNWTNNYTFWASYVVLPEPTLMKFSYRYDLYDSREGYKPGVPSDDGFAPDDHPYWSPLNYWITRFSFYFKHQLSNDALARGVPSYYTIEYSLGYDSEENDLHELKGSFNFEIARNYTVSASYGYLDLDVYQQTEAFLSLMYRF
ncbi:MAG: tetratricopeptide repeat protein, partial [Deltaproteobacteria bacterium]|nr:tetratricopeptide repeat protein [Deltaproteobacteria bacterium]